MTPETPQMLRDRAAEAERQAAEATLPRVRETLLYGAVRWRELADEDEAPALLCQKTTTIPT